MNSEREIVKKLFESNDIDVDVNDEELEEASFEAGGHTYSCAFGHYSKDGESISREEYFKAKDSSKSKEDKAKDSSKSKEDKASAEPVRKVSVDKDVFNADDYSKEAYDLLDTILDQVADVRSNLFDDVDIDDAGLNSYGSTSGDRKIVFRANTVGHFSKKSSSYKPLKSKEIKELTAELEKSITLPKDDSKYEYSLDVSYDDMSLRIALNRNER